MRWLLDIDPNGGFWRFSRAATVAIAVVGFAQPLSTLNQSLVYVYLAAAAALAFWYAYQIRARGIR
jgi:hypothetical protein